MSQTNLSSQDNKLHVWQFSFLIYFQWLHLLGCYMQLFKYRMNFPLSAYVDSAEEAPYLLLPTACLTLWAWGRNTANSCSPSEEPPALLTLPPALKYFLPLHCSSLYGFCKLLTWKAIKLYPCYRFSECYGSLFIITSSDFKSIKVLIIFWTNAIKCRITLSQT